MRISGIDVSERKPEVVVIPFGGQEVAVWCYPVLSYEVFDQLFPKPVPQLKKRKLANGKEEMIPDTSYQDALDKWTLQRFNWMVLTSLKDVEWDTVILDDPATWENYNEELTKTFSSIEVNRIISTVMKVCGLSSNAIDEATDSFLASMADLDQEK